MPDKLSTATTLPTARASGCPFDPPPELGELRQHGPISRLAFPDGHLGWVVTSQAAARTVLADRRFSSRIELIHQPIPVPGVEKIPRKTRPGSFIRMDPPEHTRYRHLLTGQFTVRRMKALEPRIEQITTEHLDAMEEHGPPVDLVPAFSLPIPSLVICELLGVPYSYREKFQKDTSTLLRLTSPPDERVAAMEAVNDLLRDLVLSKRTNPDDALISGLIRDTELNDDELVGISTLLLLAGHETTANMLALGTFALLQRPDQLAALRKDPDLIEGAVEELLRYLSIVQFGTVRAALEDVEVDGQLVKAGETVVISIPLANRDPDRFDHPEALDVTRSAAGHVAFGHGIHQCLGQQLARIEMRIGYRELFRRFPTLRLAVAPDEVPLRTDMAIYGVHHLPVAW
ncbi:cytochrome P450 [Actinopolymorpha alba]|uniref:cytochrome P450 n=1 Tax=Actinopolymorpha alba TaxID=533267 RepID=UPI000379BE87|nr:cytochrome P450 [Actinopolymorpha alba]